MTRLHLMRQLAREFVQERADGREHRRATPEESPPTYDARKAALEREREKRRATRRWGEW